MIRKVNNNKFGVIEYAIDSEEDLLDLPREDTNNAVYAILRKGNEKLVYLYSKELKDYILINGDLEEINAELENINEQLDNITNKVNWVHINETSAVQNNPNFDNSLVIKDLLENNDYVKIEGTFYTNEITVDRSGRGQLFIDGNFKLIAKDSYQNHILKLQNGTFFHNGTIEVDGAYKTYDNIYIDFGTSHSKLDTVISYRALRNGLYNEYVTDIRINKARISSCGERLTSSYIYEGEGVNGSKFSVVGIKENCVDISFLHFFIIDGTLYKIVDCYLDDGKQIIEVYPKITTLTNGTGKVLIGCGIWNEGTKLLLDDYDIRTTGVALLNNSQYGITVSHSILQGCPVGFYFNKDGVGTKNSEDNLILAPWFETDTEFPVVTSITSRSGITIVEPFTTVSDFNMVTKFGNYAPVTIIKNGRIFQNNLIDKITNNAGTTKEVQVGTKFMWCSTSGTSQQIIKLINSTSKKYTLFTDETTIYVNHKYLRPIKIMCEDGYTIEGNSELIIDNLQKGIIKIMLDVTEKNYIIISI